MATASLRHGDRKGPPDPTLPPSPLLYDVGAAKPVYSSGESGAMGMGGPLRSPCRIINRSPPSRENHDERNPVHQAERESAVLSLPFDVFELYCDKSGPYSPISSFFRGGKTRISSPRSLVFSVLLRWAQPERDMCWLHRLLHDGQQVIVQLVQVHLLAQR